MKKYSKQRELILQSLRNRMDHPTAEMLYNDLKNQMPEIGIATVYRNLSDLSEMGEVIKLKSQIGPDRFDANKEEHIHFECNKCHEIEDIYIINNHTKKIHSDIKKLPEDIDAECEHVNIWLTGLCKKCKRLANLNLK